VRTRPDTDRQVKKHTINLYEGDLDELRYAYPDIAPSVIIRKLIMQHLETLATKRSKGKIEITEAL
jgi:hypothetical protein